MSKEKFKVWDKKNQSWLNPIGQLLINSSGLVYDYYFDYLSRFDPSEVELVESTGLLDINENPIFIGDILSSKEYYNNDLDANYKRVGAVKFNDGYNYFDVGYYLEGFEFKNGKVWRKFRNDLVKAKYDINGNYNTKPISNGGYIIGNLYENPELLGGQNE
jgi:uncharacterized phage protein (TIGR01671 family)